MRNDAAEIVGVERAGARLYTCEHASNRVPAPWRPRPADRRLLAMHWGYDIGARNVTIELARLDASCAVLSRFSRLLIDPNRDPADATAVLRDTDDGCPSFNRQPDLTARVGRFHRPFHAALGEVTARMIPRLLVSIHSFTPVFRGNHRAVEAGVLFDSHDALCGGVVDALRQQGFRTEPNEPYSGKLGLIYSAARHGGSAGIPYFEIELRQDLIASGKDARAVARRVWRALEAAA